MADRRGPRLVTQRRLEVVPPVPPPGSIPAASTPAPASPVPTRSANEPVPASNRGLLERQLKWHKEKAKFENSRRADEPPP